ncbi:histidine kinase [uncultured Psychroserpens sp.]|uniref:tetratricopeptide repeat-containing sensor histidine kinase n=1 Tax=uncultured Psychroserpens sp. TaxID=255436 RepID=UPI002602728F|nr:histidine kinase [uncultured Psychroserpens sp.]
MLKRFHFILIIVLVGCSNENSEEDLKNDLNLIHKLQELSIKKISDSTLIYLNRAERIIESNYKIPDTFRIENIFLKGFYYRQINEIDSASLYFHKTIDLIEAPNTRDRNLVYYKNTWETDENNSKLANAISTAQKFIDISDEDKNAKGLTYAYNFLERVNLDLGNYEKLLHYNAKALEAAKKSLDTAMYVITANSRTSILYDLGKKKEAFRLLDSIDRIKTVPKDVRRQVFRNYGVLYFYDEEYTKAIEKYKQALEFSKVIEGNKNYNLIESYNNIAEAYLFQKDYSLAERYLDSTKAIIQPNSFSDYVTFYHELRFKVNYRTKDNEDELFEEYLDLIANNNKQHEEKIEEELIALKLSNEKEQEALTQKKEAEITNVKLMSLLGFLILLLLIVYLFYKQRQFKFEKQDLQMQQRLLRSQMSPHFMFNTLSAIQNQIKENQKGAVNYLMKFSRLLRLILENSLHNYVEIDSELESLRKYIDLQLLRFPNQFEYTISLENFEEDEGICIPPMLLQPFVENSIEHGFLGINYKGRIHIKLELQDKHILCEIEDNGIGLQPLNKAYQKSVSTQLISTFIYKTTKQKVITLDKKNENLSSSGIVVKFLIPYKFSEHD